MPILGPGNNAASRGGGGVASSGGGFGASGGASGAQAGIALASGITEGILNRQKARARKKHLRAMRQIQTDRLRRKALSRLSKATAQQGASGFVVGAGSKGSDLTGLAGTLEGDIQNAIAPMRAAESAAAVEQSGAVVGGIAKGLAAKPATEAAVAFPGEAENVERLAEQESIFNSRASGQQTTAQKLSAARSQGGTSFFGAGRRS